MISEVPSIAKNWWLFVVLGVICLATGIATIVWPDITLLALGLLAGIYLLIAAFMEIIDAITGDASSRALSAILGVHRADRGPDLHPPAGREPARAS